MILPDLNLLVYTYNSAAPLHREARNWWEGLLSGTDPVGLTWTAMSGYIRLMTHPRILDNPMRVQVATSHVREWLDQPCVIIIEPGPKFSNYFLNYLNSVGTAGNLTTDAYLAAMALEHQAVLHSTDADFARFSGLRWLNPLALG